MNPENKKAGPAIFLVVLIVGIIGAVLWWLIQEFLGMTRGFAISVIGIITTLSFVLLRRRIPKLVSLIALPVIVFSTTVVFWNAGENESTNPLGDILLPYRFWTSGHWMGVFFLFWTGLWLLSCWNEMGEPPEDRDEVISGPKLISHAEAIKRVSGQGKKGGG